MPTPNIKAAKHKFVSYHSAVDEGEFAVTVGFSRDPADEDSFDGLLLQRGRGEINGDIPGIRGVYVEIPIQRHVVYGGISEAILHRDSFTLRFDETTPAKMGGLQEIFVRFELADEAFASVRAGLRFIFTDCSCYREVQD